MNLTDADQPATTDELLPEIWGLIASRSTSSPIALSTTDYNRLQELIDSALDLLGPEARIDPLALERTMHVAPAEDILSETEPPAEADSLAANVSAVAETSKETPSVYARRNDHRQDKPLVSLLWFWKGWAYHALDPQQQTRPGSPVFAFGLANFELIEDAYLRSMAACVNSDAPVLMLAYLYWQQAHWRRVLELFPELGQSSLLELIEQWAVMGLRGKFRTLLSLEGEGAFAGVDYTDARLAIARFSGDYLEENIFEFDYKEYLPFSEYTGWIPFVMQIGEDLWGTGPHRIDIPREPDGLTMWLYNLAVTWDYYPIDDPQDAERIRHYRTALERGLGPNWENEGKVQLAELLHEANGHDGNEALALFEEVVATKDDHRGDFSLDMLPSCLYRFLAQSPKCRTDKRVMNLIDKLVEIGRLTLESRSDREWAWIFGLRGEAFLEDGAYSLAHTYLSVAYETLGGEARAAKFASACVQLDRLEEAHRLLSSIPHPTLEQSALMRLLHQRIQEPHPVLSGELNELKQMMQFLAQKQSDAAESTNEVLTTIGAQSKSTLESTKRHEANLERLINNFEAGKDWEAKLRRIELALGGSNEWIDSVIRRAGDGLKSAPADFRQDCLSAERLYQTLRSEGFADFTPVMLLWGKMLEITLRKVLLLPFARWLDSTKHTNDIALPDGEPLSLESERGLRQSSWETVLNRGIAADKLMVAAAQNERHPFREFLNTHIVSEALSARWKNPQIIAGKLRDLRGFRNRAAHDPEPVSQADAERIHNLLWKDSLVRDLCALLGTVTQP